MPFLPFAVAALTKGFLYTLCSSVQVEGLDNLLTALQTRKGVLTVSNHISVMDDPGALSAALPLSYFLDKRTTRWTLGASDVCFTNTPLRYFFTKGQVIECYRSSADPDKAGIYQRAIDIAIKKLDEGMWLHIFPEAKVNLHPKESLLRFRWGVSRILMETKNDYEILPIWLEGFDDLMPEPRNWPRFIPRFFGTNLRIVIGRPITDRIRPLIDEYRRAAGGPVPAIVGTTSPKPPKYEGDTELAKSYRIKIATALREEVEKLGRNKSDYQMAGKIEEITE